MIRAESDIQREIVEALEKCGAWPIRLQSGRVRVRGGMMHLCPPGTPDLQLIGLGFFETKTPKTKLSKTQIEWHKRAAALGVRVAVVRSPREAIETLLAWKGDK